MRGVALQNSIIVGRTHLLEKILEAPFAHMLALVLVLTEPRESKFTNTRPDTLKEALEIRSCRVAMNLAPRIRVPLHMEDVTDVSDPRRG